MIDTVYEFFIDGKPDTWQRVWRDSGGRGHRPGALNDWREHVRGEFLAKYYIERMRLKSGPVAINMVVNVPIPPSVGRGKRKSMVIGETRPTSQRTGDGDNYEKAIWDALQKHAYQNDAQIVSWSGEKWYADPEHCGIMLKIGRPR